MSTQMSEIFRNHVRTRVRRNTNISEDAVYKVVANLFKALVCLDGKVVIF